MPRPNRTHLPTCDPNLQIVITDDGSRTLKNVESGDTWHSESGALKESRLVFYENGGVAEAFERGHPVRIFEVGFGTGLNFWLTASEAIKHRVGLTYVSVEPKLLSREIVRQLAFDEIECCEVASSLFLERLHSLASSHDGFVLERNGVELRLIEKPLAAVGLGQFEPFDVIYHDPFGPDSAPELWSEPTLAAFFDALGPQGRLVTYCVKSSVQRLLRSVGFCTKKTRGPEGGKREVLIAIKPSAGNR